VTLAVLCVAVARGTILVVMRLGVVLPFLVGLGCSFESGDGTPASGVTVGGTETSGGTGSTGEMTSPTDPTDPTNATDPTSGSTDPTDPTDPTNPTDPGTTDGSTTDDSGTTSMGETSTSTGGETGESSSTGEPVFDLCDDTQMALRACYDFENADSGTLSDGSMYANDGTTVGLTLESGPFGSAARGSASAEISVPDSATLDIVGTITFEAWVRVDSLPESGRDGILDNDGQYSLMLYADQGLRCNAAGANLFFAPVVTTEWFHVACVHDGDDLSMWIDGAMTDSAPSNGSLPAGNMLPMSLADTSPGFTEPMDGLLGGVRVWNVARSASELAEAAGVLE